MNFLKKFDIYGASYSINSLGNETYKTYFGLICTILTGVLIVLAFLLFGRDFMYKKNPNVIQSEFLPDESDPVYVNSANFTVAWRVEDENENIISEDQRFVWPKIAYSLLEKNEDKEFDLKHDIKLSSKKCSETAAVNNKDFTSQNLETLQCIDFEELRQLMGSSTDVPLWGDWDENHVSTLYFEFMSCKFDLEKDDYYDCLSFEEVQRRSGLLDQYVAFYLPRFTFRPENVDEPFKVYYESLYFKLSPYTSFYEIYRYGNVKIDDDIGWIFEDFRQIKTIEKLSITRSFNFLLPSAYETPGAAKPYALDLMFGRKQILITRAYMKIQTVAANIGGIMKIIQLTFMVISQLIAKWHMNAELVNRFFTCNFKKSNPLTMKNVKREASTQNIRIKKSFRDSKIFMETGFLTYFADNFLCFKKKTDFFVAMKKIHEVLDVEEIYRMHLKIERLISMLFKEEDKKQIDTNLTQIVRNGNVFLNEEIEEEANNVSTFKPNHKQAN